MATIALIYGRDDGARDAVAEILKALGHSVRDFASSKTDNPDRSFNREIVNHLFADVDAAITILSPDEEGYLKTSLRGASADDWRVHDRMRPNVAIEYGLAVAKLEARVIEVSFGFPYFEIPSDWMGLNPITWKDATTTGIELRDRLTALGITSQDPAGAFARIRYVAPEPTFADALPPYDFIAHPFRLRQVDLNGIWADQSQQWRDAGYEIGYEYTEQRATWQAAGWRPMILKDHDFHEYVTAVFDMGVGVPKKIWLVRKKP